MAVNNDFRSNLLGDIAQSLNVAIDDVPGDLSDKQVDAALNLAEGTTSVKRCRGDFPIPSYKIGRSRKTPLSAVIDFKLNQLEKSGTSYSEAVR